MASKLLKSLRKWRQRRELIDRIDWAQFHLEMDYARRPAGNHYIERQETFAARRARLIR